MRPKTSAPDSAALERLRERPCGPQHRMTGELHLVIGVEDAHASRASLLGWQHESRLGEADLERERLHGLGSDAAGIGEDRELVAGERGIGEDVDDEEAVRRHRGTLPPPGAYRLRPWRTRSWSRT